MAIVAVLKNYQEIGDGGDDNENYDYDIDNDSVNNSDSSYSDDGDNDDVHGNGDSATSFPGLSYEDEARHEKALVWAGHVTTQKLAVFDSYSSRSGKIFFNEIYKSSKQINSQKTSQSILFMCRAKFGTNHLKSLKTLSKYTDISGDFEPQAKLHPSCI